MKFIFVVLVFVAPNLLLSQNFNEPNIDKYFFSLIDSIDNPKDYYNKIKSFNKKKLFQDKKLLTHKLDSATEFRIVAGKLIKTGRGEYIYQEGKDILLSWIYDSNIEALYPFGYSTVHFDNGFLVKQTYSNWDGDYTNLDDENPQVRRRYFYNKHDNLRSIWSQNSSSVNTNHISSLDSLIYNSENQLIERQRYFWEPLENDIVKTSIIKYHHNDKGMVESIVQSRYTNEFGWYIQDSTYMLYNNNEMLEIEDLYSKGPILEDFFYASQNIYFYNEDESINKVITNTGVLLENNYWSTQEIGQYKYHDYGSLENYLSYIATDPYDYTSEKLYESDYIHDKNVLVNNIRFPRTRFSGFFDNSHYFEKHMILKEEHYGDGNTFEPRFLDFIIEYHYSGILTDSSNEIITNSNYGIYPNPGVGLIKIIGFDSPKPIEFSLLNLQGERLMNLRMNSDEKINIEDISSGIYIYTIMFDNKLISGKLILL